ncbi:MAG: hypothetical protein ACK5DD_10775 [Cyclobacteriaceae bacterium]|jgi:hypothetical protein
MKIVRKSLIVFVLPFAFLSFGQETRAKTYVHYEIFGGGWIPLGNSRLLGDHFLVGGKIGLNKNGWRGDWLTDFKLGKSRNSYLIRYNDSLIVAANGFFGIYSGLGLSKDFASLPKGILYGGAGIGVDFFTASKKDPPVYPERRGIGSLNYNFTIGMRSYGRRSAKYYMGWEISYNLVNYKNEGGTPLDGNSIAIRLIIGLEEIYTGADRTVRILYYN